MLARRIGIRPGGRNSIPQAEQRRIPNPSGPVRGPDGFMASLTWASLPWAPQIGQLGVTSTW
jgi:hypothetical protein